MFNHPVEYTFKTKWSQLHWRKERHLKKKKVLFLRSWQRHRESFYLLVYSLSAHSAQDWAGAEARIQAHNPGLTWGWRERARTQGPESSSAALPGHRRGQDWKWSRWAWTSAHMGCWSCSWRISSPSHCTSLLQHFVICLTDTMHWPSSIYWFILQMPVVARTESSWSRGVRNPMEVFHVGDKESGKWGITCCLLPHLHISLTGN